ncbi:ATP-binding protein [Kutzneria sp. 744]|uniref:PAS domain-containing sensor histidine kinase n=1 Tax=Kutzneria sp. (strain 744) TaxID=345341 RepID=UPI0003EEB3F1|nr:ATP-binding protein [Kutzneria sp. 744]EWM19153.1 two-component system sensor kinase potassium transporter [Kutzneria sp. 744]
MSEHASAWFPDDIIRLIVTASADGILAVDGEGVIRLCNRAAEDLFARPAADLVGSPFGYPIAVGVSEIDLILPGGRKRVVEMRVTATTLHGKRLHVAALRDVTRRRDIERALQAALERQNIVLAVAAHELHSPLAAISVLAHVLRDNGAGLTQQRRAEITDRIIERIAYLQALVRKLLTASRIDAAGGSPVVEHVPVLEVVIEQLAGIEEKSRDVRVTCPEGLVAAVDRAEFCEMLANYLENAFSYGQPPVQIQGRAKAGWVEVRVIDQGPGVPTSFVPYLFERFRRGPGSERRTDGTGLGLWIVRNLAQANGGDAWYEPGTRRGACFCLRLRQAVATRAMSG